MLLIKNLRDTFGKDLTEIKEQVQQPEDRISQHESLNAKTEVQVVAVKKILEDMKTGTVISASVTAAPFLRGFKVMPLDGTTSWPAYRIQFEAVMKANGWSKSQAMTALTLELREQALTTLEALDKNVTYEQLVEALESRYGDAHPEHVFRAQLKERVQRSNESLQQWALEIEKLVRKAYRSLPALIDGSLVQEFVDGIRDLEVRAAV
ncbi:uncharacterized protein LOC114247946 [Bombyx mandarina]|uniref:Uncharacterized protein LOC114247946 n=1 Tax=Bombyx mandarina TaxID=7092 RepID=A0A6J2K794_BOMMA|nr:uncharacterized protein LOC114247946 [Bombyx mandarina]